MAKRTAGEIHEMDLLLYEGSQQTSKVMQRYSITIKKSKLG